MAKGRKKTSKKRRKECLDWGTLTLRMRALITKAEKRLRDGKRKKNGEKTTKPQTNYSGQKSNRSKIK